MPRHRPPGAQQGSLHAAPLGAARVGARTGACVEPASRPPRPIHLGLASGALGLALLACSHAGSTTTPEGDAANGASVDAADPTDGAIDAGVVPPADTGWWRDDVFYEIFVRSFADSDGDGIGDFVGLTEHLDVLNDGDPRTTTDLGVTGIWLMPVFESPSYHGYDVTDYRRIEPDYGTRAEFEAFLAAAHERGIRVILDLMINHTSNQHPWFLEAREGPDAEYRDHYLWRDEDPGWTQPWSPNPVWHRTGSGYYYGLFWSGMPDLNLDNPAVEEQIGEIMDYWLDVGVDGFRMDAARHYFETEDGTLVDVEKVHPFVQRLHREIAQEHPDALLVAEVWSDVSTVAPYFGEEGDEFQLAFGFDTASAILTSAKDRTVAAFEQNIRYQNEEYADVNYEAPFLTNHDMPRVMRQLDGDEGAMRIAAAALFAMPGTPFIYYGEEIGMRGGADSRDEEKRTPMRWTDDPPGYGFTTAAMAWHEADEPEGVSVEAQRGVEDSLWTLYRDLVAVRTTQPALADGTSRLPAVTTSARGATAVLREAGAERVLVVLNFDDAPTGRVLIQADGQPEIIFSEGVKAAPFVSTETTGTIEIPDLAGRAFAFIRLR